MNFVHLHNHTHYSLLDGLTKIDDLIGRAVEQGQEALAITDHGVMYGVIEFYQKCKKAGIKPIIGVEAYLAPASRHDKAISQNEKNYNHLLLLAKNNQGYENLIKLTTIGHLEGFYYKPRIDWEVLSKYKEGLIAGSACLGGEIPRLINSGQLEKAKKRIIEYNELFGQGNYYLELMHHPELEGLNEVNEKLIEFSKELSVPVIATNDIHYLKKEDDEAQDILLCLQNKKKISDTDRMNMRGADFSARSTKEMQEAFKHIPEAIENTVKIAEQCDVEIELGKIQLPYFEVPKNHDGNSYLRKLCEDGLIKRYKKNYKEVSQEIKERFDYELEVIKKMGWPSYFLIVADFVNWAKDNKIVVGPGRGSAAGSLVCYLTGITNLDPLEYDLLFERFLNPERISMPDIDLDFADIRREEVINYVEEKYGKDHVAQIITFGTMAARAAVRDVGRVLDYPYDYCDKLAKMIPMFTKLDEALKTVPELKDIYRKEEEARKILDFAKKLEGVARHASTHACGVLITDKPLDNYVPTQYASSADKSIVSQYSLHPVEDLGLLKMDFLGLKNLTIIESAIKIIKGTKGIEIDVDKIPLDDKKTYELFQKGETTGVFQFESSGMKRYLRELKPSEFEDVIAMVALYRPGPMEWIPDYIAGKHGKKKVEYLHEKLAPILAKTYGVAIYQEQVMQIARDLAGFTMGEADVLRKAVGKKIVKLLATQKEKFIDGCVKNSISQKLAETIFSFIEPFAGYGFNRSHAACYALIGYQTAFLKAHWPAEFSAALLTADQQNTDRIAIEIDECRNMGIKIMPPDVNESFSSFTVVSSGEKSDKDEDTVRFGLRAIKNVGQNIANVIIKERKENGRFKSMVDFLERITDKDLNKKSLESLIKCGGFDNFGDRGDFLHNIETLLKFNKEISREKNSKQNSLFGNDKKTSISGSLRLEKGPEINKRETLKWERELLGLYITEHPFNEFKRYLTNTIPLVSLKNHINDESVNTAGIISTIKKIVTRKNETMIFVKIEDSLNNAEILVFPKLYRETIDLWVEGRAIMCQGKISDKDQEVKILANKALELKPENIRKSIEDFHKIEVKTNNYRRNNFNNNQNGVSWNKKVAISREPVLKKVHKPLCLIIHNDKNSEKLKELKETLVRNQGESKVYFKINDNGKDRIIETGFRVDYNDNIINLIKKDFNDIVEVVIK
jgi:DNA polymerase-3 subunit alpha